MFTILVGARVVFVKNGIYKQAQVYLREGSRDIYAQFGGGFVRLSGDGATSTPNVRYESLDLPFSPEKGDFGRPRVPSGFTGVAL